VGAIAEAREEVDVWEVVVLCEKTEERSEAVVAVDWMDVRVRGGGGGNAAAAGGMGGGGAGRRVLTREREELLAEGTRIRAGEVTPDRTGEGEEPCDPKLLTEPRG